MGFADVLIGLFSMKGHGGAKWRQGACEALEAAKMLNSTTKNHRSIAYHAGWACEQLMVAIGIKQRGLMDVPNGEKGGNWHSLRHLAKAHAIEPALNEAFKTDKALRASWLVVKDWESDDRFPTASVNGKDALELLNAVANPNHGIFQWLLSRYETI